MQLTVDGKKVFAYTGGREPDRARPSTIFIHGAAHDHSVWLLQSRYFAYHGHSVLALDLPGHGRSEGPPAETIREIAEWVVRTLDVLEIPRAAVVGHSMGSLAALEMAAHRGDRVASIALVGAGFPMAVTESLMEAASKGNHAAFEMINIWSHGIPLGGNPAPGLWSAGLNMRLLERSAPGVLYRDLKACNDYRDGLESARHVKCPTLFVLGARDQMVPSRTARQLISAIPQARTVWVEPCGHALMSEQPDRVLDALRDFMQQP